MRCSRRFLRSRVRSVVAGAECINHAAHHVCISCLRARLGRHCIHVAKQFLGRAVMQISQCDNQRLPMIVDTAAHVIDGAENVYSRWKFTFEWLDHRKPNQIIAKWRTGNRGRLRFYGIAPDHCMRPSNKNGRRRAHELTDWRALICGDWRSCCTAQAGNEQAQHAHGFGYQITLRDAMYGQPL